MKWYIAIKIVLKIPWVMWKEQRYYKRVGREMERRLRSFLREKP